jgi:hypothetical protein
MLEDKSTKVVANPIANPLMAEFVTASTGHSPSNDLSTGFSSHTPFRNSCFIVALLFAILLPIDPLIDK